MSNQIAYISEAFVSKKFGYTESRDEESGLMSLMLEGEFQRANAKNRNTRMYSNPLLSRETTKLAALIEDRGGLPMGMDHPIPDGSDASMVRVQRIGLENSCGLTTMLEMHGDIVYGKAKALVGDNSTGDKIAAFVKHGYKPGVSSRGLGGDPIHTNEGYVLVPEDYNMICYDFVTNPSTHNAILQRSFQEEVNNWEQSNIHERKVWEVLTDLTNKNLGVK